jgi:hypothetical protein
MKIAEVRSLIEKYSEEQLKSLIIVLYKAIPKAVKEDNAIDEYLQNPASPAQNKNKVRSQPDIAAIEVEIGTFLKNAYAQNYMLPNLSVSKQNRPKWRFIVKQFYRDLLAAAAGNNTSKVAELMERLYLVLCYSCENTIFTAYDAFESIGISQAEFFQKVLALKFQCEDRAVFIRHALLLMVNHGLNRYTLYENLIHVILEFAGTPDLREMIINDCQLLIADIRKKPSQLNDYRIDYEKENKLNTLTHMAFMAYARRYEYLQAIAFFKENFVKKNKEVALYILLEWLFGLDQKDLFVQEYEQSVSQGIIPRESLKQLYRYIKTNNKMPTNFYR